MSDYNQVTLLGNLGADPVMSTYGEDNKPVANFAIGTSKKVKGEMKTEWHKVSAFGQNATFVGEQFKKGSRVLVEGELQTSKWDKQGTDQYSTGVVASKVQFG